MQFSLNFRRLYLKNFYIKLIIIDQYLITIWYRNVSYYYYSFFFLYKFS